MSNPLPKERVQFIRELFDNQGSNLDKTLVQEEVEKQVKADPELVKKNLVALKEEVDAKMDDYTVRRGQLFRQEAVEETIIASAADETWMRSSEDSFLSWERDCEMTMKEPVVKREEKDQEMAAIANLMKEYNLDGEEFCGDFSADETQLADVEPPSGMWGENTILQKMTSPVKMVGLMRPSTIVEENTLFNDSLASSYKTARSKAETNTTYQSAASNTISSTTSFGTGEVIDLDDSNNDSEKTLDEISSIPDESYGTSSTISGVKELTRDSEPSNMSSDSLLDSPKQQFNDTLERIEYMQEKGRQLLEKQKTPLTQQPTRTLLPASASSINKEFYPSPKSNDFKKPSQIRSPQIKFVPSKRNFDHIVSPVATYIKDIPSSALLTKSKPVSLFPGRNSPLKTTPNKCSDAKENTSGNKLPVPQWNIPRKVFTSTNNRHEIDKRHLTKIPGGTKVQKIIEPATGMPNTITKHEGRIKMDNPAAYPQPRDSIFDESLANLSIVSGDVSVQVIRDCKKH